MARKPSVHAAITKAIRALDLEDSDAPAVALARHYAIAVDEGASIWHVGGQFRELLAELGMTPKARKALLGDRQRQDADPLDAFRDEVGARRAARAGS